MGEIAAMYKMIKYMDIIFTNTKATIQLFFIRIEYRKFVKKHPGYCFLYSKESDRRLTEYIEDHDVRMKKIAAEAMLVNIYGFMRVAKKYNLSVSERHLIKDLVFRIKKELQII